ncbi:type II toxin-antitoxin system PemK/MazF family toxin [Halarcobacter sp.]|uniref:type II toxin-antitoxin system PemK/MazF family toxin n=1 Tax=Halarcobacter sp. TaxID=2321133 RepID=UPI002AA62F1E|nr:type II toxin-antitoxin system PemK/MazF family toxin [Halarcobacter sp.]
MDILQYHIYEIDVSGAIKGDEMPENVIYGTILSPNEMNDILKTVIIAPMCDKCAITPTTFLINEKTRIRVDQISSLPKKRITKYIGKLDISQIPKIKKTLEEMLVK